MKRALVDGQLVPAAPDAPATAVCPHCQSVVERRNRQGTWFWRHVKRPRGGCQPQPEREPDSELTLAEDGAGHQCWRRRVGELTIELRPADDETQGGYLKLQRLGAEANGQPSGLTLRFSEVHSLAQALLDMMATLPIDAGPG